MSVNETLEPLVRFAFYLPIAVIAAQVMILSRLLPSRAWMLLGIGFGMVAVLRALPFFMEMPTIIYLAGLVCAYAFIAAGFWKFTRDVRYVLNLRFIKEEAK